MVTGSIRRMGMGDVITRLAIDPYNGNPICPPGTAISGGITCVFGDGSTIDTTQVGPDGLAPVTPPPAGWQQTTGGQAIQFLAPAPTPNALDRVTPIPGAITPAPTTNVINAPQAGSPVTPDSIANARNQSSTGTPVGPNNTIPATSWVEDNWPLLAAAAVGLFIMTRGK